MERRIDRFEAAQTQTIESLKSSNEYNQFLILGIGAIFAFLVAIQGYATVKQARGEGERDSRQARREGERDRTDRIGIEQVSKIMSIVEQTLESRLLTEKKAIEEMEAMKKELEKVVGVVKGPLDFIKKFEATIKSTRQVIEEQASQFAQLGRHDFRKRANEFTSLAQQSDSFKDQFGGLEAEPQDFTARVVYICGIAEHYTNQPKKAQEHLTRIAGLARTDPSETEIAYNRRVANAHYYLGVIESNFGNYPNAIAYFKKADALDPLGTDFLTKIVTAEAYAMNGDPDKAAQLLNEVEHEASKKEVAEVRLRNVYRRLRSRATLIRANMVIRGQEANWMKKAKDLLEPVYTADPNYYYATATLAQIVFIMGDTGRAQQLFTDANQIIERSGDLITLTEVRSKILLLLFAEICYKHSSMDKKMSLDHLAAVEGLLDSLPRIDSQICTVFSPLSKRNENSATIRDQIDSIRKGDVLS